MHNSAIHIGKITTPAKAISSWRFESFTVRDLATLSPISACVATTAMRWCSCHARL